MNWADIVAVVGAAAWVPQIWRAFQRPKVTPIVGGQIEIGFSVLGPVFNPNIAFRTQRRSALVTGIEFRVRHERGQITHFRCVQLVEHGVHSESTTGERAFQQRQQDVVALVLMPTMIVERKTNSREVGCLNRLEPLNIALGRAIDRTRRPGTDWVSDLERSPEYAEIRRFLEQSFVWDPGEYTATCAATVAGRKQPFICAFSFVLGERAVTSLRANMELLQRAFHEELLPPEAKSKEKLPPYNWVYPYALTSE